MLIDLVAVFIALFVGHSVADHWVQTSCQAIEKAYGPPGSERKLIRRGQLACVRHVATLTATKVLLVLAVLIPFNASVRWWQVAAGLGVDALSHYWADRRWTLEELARYLKKGEFYDQGTDLTDVAGERRPHIGTGRYALDQSWHHLWLLVGAWIATVPLP